MESQEIYKKNEEYKKYILNHKENIRVAWNNIKSSEKCTLVLRKNKTYFDTIYPSHPIYDIEKESKREIDELILVHDDSKFGKEEFEPYRKNFYPISLEEKKENKSNFFKAWKHHYTNNLHHWNWWSETGNKSYMTFNFVVEMCCDWIAMSMANKGNALQWFYQQTNIDLGVKQKSFVEELLNEYYKYYS